ncbi:MAG: glucuronate isomerase [Candidatus Hydrogenedentota bacterium]
MSDRTFDQNQIETLQQAVHDTVQKTPLTDIHTHLYAPQFGGLLLAGVDELLTYHYLVAEYFRVSQTAPETFFSWEKPAQAAAIWQALFLERSPVSEACRGVVTALGRLGAPVAGKDLEAIRAWYAAMTTEQLVDRVFEAANVRDVVMTNDPFDSAENPVWLGKDGPGEVDPRFHTALRIDPLVNDWPNCTSALEARGYQVSEIVDAMCVNELQRFLNDWIDILNPRYLAVSLPPDFVYPAEDVRTCVIDKAIVPVTAARNIPFALMIGVKRGVNPALQLAGDGVDKADLSSVEALCRRYPKNKFMLTTLSRENQHTACVIARKFRNLLLFGCWWFLNNPSLIGEMTRMRIELLGTSIIPQHSDCRVLDQLVYKWAHSRAIIAQVLAEKYTDLVHAGWTIEESQMRTEIENMLGGNFWRFLEARF